MVDIYLITNLINGKEYVGISGRGYLKRFAQHKTTSKLKNINLSILHRAMKKYGVENFKTELLEQVDTYDEAKIKEKEYIKKFNTYIKSSLNWGYNMTTGGDGNGCSTILNLETRKEIGRKISELHKNPEYRKLFLERMSSEEVKRKISIANSGEKNGMYNNGHLISGEKNYWYGKTGEDAVNYGNVYSDEIKEKIRQNTLENWTNNEGFREKNLLHLQNLGKKQTGLNGPSSKATYLYNEVLEFVGVFAMVDVYKILDCCPSTARKNKDTDKIFKGYYIYSNPLE